MAVDKKQFFKNIKGQKGQALFEFIVFLPFLILFSTLLVTFGNAINGSINQQKVVRQYFFYGVRGNSMTPDLRDLTLLASEGIGMVGVDSLGWREKSGASGDTESFGACYKINSLFGSFEDSCDAPTEFDKTNYVKVFTFFGLCGESYSVKSAFFERDYFARLSGSCRKQ